MDDADSDADQENHRVYDESDNRINTGIHRHNLRF